MNRQKIMKQVIGMLLLIFLLSGCVTPPTATLIPEAPTATLTSKPPIATITPKPSTATPTPVPIIKSLVLVPRYTLPSAPYFPVEILGVFCNYQRDSWNTQTAYIAYACPDLDVTWLSVRFTNLEEGQTALDLFGELPSEGAMLITPADLLGDIDNLILTGRVEKERAENSEYAYFMLYEAESYAISSEVFFPEDSTTLEEFYRAKGEVVHHAVLEIMLEKVMSEGMRLEPTPMATNQQNLYDQIAPWLVTEAEANEFYQGASDMFGDSFDGVWVSFGDEVDIQRESVCRVFEDRSNADAPLVTFWNCVYQREPGYELSKLKDSFPNAIVLESAFEYPDQSVIYGSDQRHTSFQAFVLQDNLLFYVSLESRALAGQTAEDIFNEFNDGFIYNVMMTNLERYDLETASHVEAQEKKVLFIGDWVSTDPKDGSNQKISISEDNGVYNVSYDDDLALSCGLTNAVGVSGTGLGTANGNVLSVEFSLYCLTDPQSFLGSVHVDYIYNETSDTLSNSAGAQTLWERR